MLYSTVNYMGTCGESDTRLTSEKKYSTNENRKLRLGKIIFNGRYITYYYTRTPLVFQA